MTTPPIRPPHLAMQVPFETAHADKASEPSAEINDTLTTKPASGSTVTVPKLELELVTPRLFKPDHPSALTRPASAPIVAPSNRDPTRMAHYLWQNHLADAATIREAFGMLSVASEHHYIINTVSENEGTFLADYLGVPHKNVLRLPTRDLRLSPRYRSKPLTRVKASAEAWLDDKMLDGCAVTLLGHISFEPAGPHLGHLSASELWSMLQQTKPTCLNLFSCHSTQLAIEIFEMFADEGWQIRQGACFTTEVSPYPPQRGARPPSFFYAGPEVGAGASILNMQQHSPIASSLHLLNGSAESVQLS